MNCYFQFEIIQSPTEIQNCFCFDITINANFRVWMTISVSILLRLELRKMEPWFLDFRKMISHISVIHYCVVCSSTALIVYALVPRIKPNFEDTRRKTVQAKMCKNSKQSFAYWLSYGLKDYINLFCKSENEFIKRRFASAMEFFVWCAIFLLGANFFFVQSQSNGQNNSNIR